MHELELKIRRLELRLPFARSSLETAKKKWVTVRDEIINLNQCLEILESDMDERDYRVRELEDTIEELKLERTY